VRHKHCGLALVKRPINWREDNSPEVYVPRFDAFKDHRSAEEMAVCSFTRDGFHEPEVEEEGRIG
jgi:hypothetical protein